MKIIIDERGYWHFEDKKFIPSMPISALATLIQGELNLKKPFTIEITG